MHCKDKWLFIFLILFIAGCKTTYEASSKYMPKFNFSSIESYSTMDRNSSFTDVQNMSDITRNTIEIAIENTLDNRGYEYQSSDSADVIVAYHVINGYRGELKSYNKGVKYCGVCLRESNGTTNKKSWLMVPGSLILDVVETDNQRSIWRSVFPLRIEEKDSSVDIHDKINTAVNTMFKNLPSTLSHKFNSKT